MPIPYIFLTEGVINSTVSTPSNCPVTDAGLVAEIGPTIR